MESQIRARHGGHQPGFWAAALTTVVMVIASVAGTAAGSPIRARPPRTTAASLRTCRTAQLGLEFGARGRRAPDTTQVITFVNVSRRSCSLDGYPTVHLSSRRRSRMRTHQTDGYLYAVPKRFVSLGPGDAASFSVAYRSRYRQEHCPRSVSADIQPPGRKRAISVGWRIAPYGGATHRPRCGALAISPVYRGTGSA